MINFITLELRPRLQTCNVFIQLQKNIDSKNIGVKLLEESIEVTVESKKVKFLTKSVKLIPSSLSALDIRSNWICFRVQTKSNSTFGSFRTEVMTNVIPKIAFLRRTVNENKNADLLGAANCNVLCAGCKIVLSQKIFVKRVLPLPDMNYDPNEWFCCNHNHGAVTQNLLPHEFDIFYGPLFFIIHASLFNENLKIDGNTVICLRCLQYLGKVHQNNSLKLWSCSVDYSLSNNELKSATDPFHDFLIAIKNSVTGVFGEEIILQSVMGKEIHSLILKPMDWNLNLMIEPKIFLHESTVTLCEVSIVKVLYKYETSNNIIDSVNKTCCEVGFQVIRAGLEHLLMSTKRFPEAHRRASDHYIGHVYLENPVNKT